jgi:hypothetical protein
MKFTIVCAVTQYILVGTNILGRNDPEDGSDTVPKRRQQINLRCPRTQKGEDLKSSAAKA